MSNRTLVSHDELLNLIHETPEEVLALLPKWESVMRIENLVRGYRAGILTPLEVAELDSLVEMVPYIREYTEMKHSA